MAEPKLLTMDELLAAPIESLTTEQISRRSAIITLMKQERELDVINEQNRKFTEEKEQRKAQIKNNLENIAREQAENLRIRKMCKHMTGGKDRPGFFQGDGDIYGHSVAKEWLPTGEIYGLCFRCQNEWHSPDWWAVLADGSTVFDGRRAVVEGRMTYGAYKRQMKEYTEMLSWTCKTFEGMAGEIPGSIRFMLPKQQQRFAESAALFEKWLEKHGKKLDEDAA